jgi:hypothetical protein
MNSASGCWRSNKKNKNCWWFFPDITITTSWKANDVCLRELFAVVFFGPAPPISVSCDSDNGFPPRSIAKKHNNLSFFTVPRCRCVQYWRELTNKKSANMIRRATDVGFNVVLWQSIHESEQNTTINLVKHSLHGIEVFCIMLSWHRTLTSRKMALTVKDITNFKAFQRKKQNN